MKQFCYFKRYFSNNISKNNLLRNEFGNVLGGNNITLQAENTFRIWHKTIQEGTKITSNNDNKDNNKEVVKQLFLDLKQNVHPKCIFSPPTYYKSWVGSDEFLCIIESVGTVFGCSFEYQRQWLSDDGHDWALEFTATIGSSKYKLNGIDLVKLDKDGKICEFTVLGRPPNAIEELKKNMMYIATPKLMALKAKQSMSSIFGS